MGDHLSKIAEPGTFWEWWENTSLPCGVPVFLGMGTTRLRCWCADGRRKSPVPRPAGVFWSVVLSMGTSDRYRLWLDYPGDARLIDCRPFLDGRMLL